MTTAARPPIQHEPWNSLIQLESWRNAVRDLSRTRFSECVARLMSHYYNHSMGVQVGNRGYTSLMDRVQYLLVHRGVSNVPTLVTALRRASSTGTTTVIWDVYADATDEPADRDRLLSNMFPDVYGRIEYDINENAFHTFMVTNREPEIPIPDDRSDRVDRLAAPVPPALLTEFVDSAVIYQNNLRDELVRTAMRIEHLSSINSRDGRDRIRYNLSVVIRSLLQAMANPLWQDSALMAGQSVSVTNEPDLGLVATVRDSYGQEIFRVSVQTPEQRKPTPQWLGTDAETKERTLDL